MAQIRLRPPGEPWRVIACGQSLNNYPAAGTYVAKAMSGRRIPWLSIATDAAPWATEYSGRAADLYPQLNHATGSLLLMLGGQTDVALGSSAATIYGLMADYAQAALAEQATVKVIALTLPPHPSITPGALETVRTTLNGLIVADSEGAFDAVVDIAADSRLDDDPTNVYLDTDGHPTDAGAVVIADLIDSSLDAILV